MEWLWSKVIRVFKVLWSYVVAVSRLIIWTIILFFTGLQRTLFMRSEIVGVEFKVIPLMCDREEFDDKLAYLDKLCIENPDLMGIEDDIPFDDLMMDEDEDDNRPEDNGENEL
jgi:hypothetical protein